ncbi:MAG: MaoC family dehydratase [Bacillota bacterium]|jgi:3-hydroxybutyryl-CoA dehydratase|nr:MaoC family dehydratase [Bacillota bacterium]
MSKVSKFYVGQSAEDTITVTEKLIYETADFSGDYNPIHTSKEYAEKTRFKGRIAHSLVCEALTSKLIGMKLPGAGAVFITMSFVCTKPVFIGDEITATATIKAIDEERDILDMQVQCRNQRDEVVVECETRVLYLGPEEDYIKDEEYIN